LVAGLLPLKLGRRHRLRGRLSGVRAGPDLAGEERVEQAGGLVLGAREQVPVLVEGDPDVRVARNVLMAFTLTPAAIISDA
jgi:hypothetical protein